MPQAPTRHIVRACLAMMLTFATQALGQETAQAPTERPTRAERWAAETAARLQLSPSQKQALEAYMVEASSRPKNQSHLSADEFHVLPTKQRYAYMIAGIEADLAVLRARSDAFERFYLELSVDQRSRLDAKTASEMARPSLASDDISQPAPEAPDYSLPSYVDADWRIKPTADDVSRVYPSQAASDHVDGKVDLSCVADENGYLTDCVVNSEEPAGQGFANAALEMTAYFRMRPAMNYGIPVRSMIRVPITFKMAE